MKKMIRTIGLAAARFFGSNVTDYRTGKVLGRALLVPWCGKVHVIGMATPVRPVFLPQKRLTFWKQEIGFTTHPAPDFPSEYSPRTEADEGNEKPV